MSSICAIRALNYEFFCAYLSCPIDNAGGSPVGGEAIY